MRENLRPTPPFSGNGKKGSYALARSLGEAMDALEACEPLSQLLGSRFVRAFIAVKRKEYQTFFRVISSWEREFLLLTV